MTDLDAPVSIECARARAAIHRRLDGEPLDPADGASLERHLATCPGCRDAAVELAEVQKALRTLPCEPFPESALDAVWSRTSRSPDRRRRRRVIHWRVAAAAAVLALALTGLWRRAATPSEAEIAQAAEEARIVLAVTARALGRAERAATHEVLGRHVSPALERTAIRWSGVPDARTGKGKNDG